MPLNHVSLWDSSKKGWRRITIQEATRMTQGRVSAKSGLFMCELCGQYVSLTDGIIREPYFKHSKEEESKDCPERTFASGTHNVHYKMDENKKGLPIRLSISNDKIFFEIGFTNIPEKIHTLLYNSKIIIKSLDYPKIEKVYSFERIDLHNITYLNIGSILSKSYNVKVDGADCNIRRYWPEIIKGATEYMVFDTSNMLKLPIDSDVKVNKYYYVITKHGLSYNKKHIQCHSILYTSQGTLYKVKALDYSEDSVKFFLKLRCRLTEYPMKFIPIWPLTVTVPFITFHNEDFLYASVLGNVDFASFPHSVISNLKYNDSKLLKIYCNERQQLISFGRLNNILDYTYLWTSDFKFKNEALCIKILDENGDNVENNTTKKLKRIMYNADYDSVFVIEKNGLKCEVINIHNSTQFVFDRFEDNKTYKIYLGLDLVWEYKRKKKQNNINTSLYISDKDLLRLLKRKNGENILIPFSYACALSKFKNYPLSYIWLRNQIKKGYLKKECFEFVKNFKGE